MADPSPDSDLGTDGPPVTGPPLWFKVFAVIALVVVLLFLVGLFTGRGGHGPARHGGAGRGDALSAGVTQHIPAGGGHTL